jgi:hypothetical protein
MMSIHQELVEAGVRLNHHESDLYALVCPESTAIIERFPFKTNVTKFRSRLDGKLWYDIPFSYDPYWVKKGANL